ncbi:arylesterase [Sphingorhabdus sp. IMCC26285]|uniref:Arylesterase n=1 Tax=Sphingorhabdus profundilacus TaxID=2509718 RepID=A0A6I4LWS2_9SPHN|nr:arylesterase [Sphingorhabdus profundilacus]MVZ96516.1 arylesterase [Sphingorhabdus profundilacus]
MNRSFWVYGALLVAIQGLGACGNNPVEEPADIAVTAETGASDKLVVAFGDSLYAGYQLAPNEGLAPQLQAALIADGIKARVHNAGASGDTTAAGKNRLAFVLDNLDRKPDLVVLGLGGNDMLRGIKPEQTRANLEAMLAELKRRQIPVVLTGMLSAPNLGADYARAFNPLYPELAARYGAKLYPFFLEGVVMDRSLMLNDNIHPNAKGVTRIVEGLSPLVEGALKEQ